MIKCCVNIYVFGLVGRFVEKSLIAQNRFRGTPYQHLFLDIFLAVRLRMLPVFKRGRGMTFLGH